MHNTDKWKYPSFGKNVKADIPKNILRQSYDRSLRWDALTKRNDLKRWKIAFVMGCRNPSGDRKKFLRWFLNRSREHDAATLFSKRSDKGPLRRHDAWPKDTLYTCNIFSQHRYLKKSRLLKFCYVPPTSVASSEGIFAAAAHSTKQGMWYVPLISISFLDVCDR